ncbi:MAG: hypothetical protein WKG01_30300 [Kofleriaceae bacterium]
MRWATLAIGAVIALGACNDLREFRGTWQGGRVGEAPAVRVGPGDAAALTIDGIDSHGLTGRLAIAGLLEETSVASVEGAEADALAGLTYSGGPLRVYLAFVAIPDGAGDAFAVISLYDDHRIEVRILRSGTSPLYGIYVLSDAGGA